MERDWFAQLLGSMSGWIDSVFGGTMRFIFSWMDGPLSSIGPGGARFFALALFAVTILWVMIGLKKEYVNLDQPKKGLLYDLRIWTFGAMLPHLIIYWMWS